uniref:ATP-binding cassette sub-family C member Sur n=1 Tax=Stomoxys calcitrans TaxID=35570 RepID=A0A1I8P9M9_STOCA
MAVIVNCDTTDSQVLHDELGTDICLINSLKWKASALCSILMFALIIYMLLKWKFRCHKTLLTFHNLRAAIALVLLAINSIELAKALLPWPQYIKNAMGQVAAAGGNGSPSNLPQTSSTIENEAEILIVVIGSSTLANAMASIVLTITLMCYHRVVEVKKSLEFLYVSSTLAVLIFILRIYELADIVYYESIMELESVIQATSAACLFFMALIDGFTVYKERYRPDYLEDYEKIGYKHTLATFYSKACFWWLTPLLWFGYMEPLELEDLGQMRVEDSARAHYDRFLLIYKTAKVKHSDKPPSLWMCYLKNSWRMFTLGGLLKLLGDLFAVIGPLAIQQIVQYIEIMYGIHYDNDNDHGNGVRYGRSRSGSNATLLQMNSATDHLEMQHLGGNIRRSIRSQHQHISIREMAQKASAAIIATTESLWPPHTNASNATFLNISNKSNEFPNINTDVYNQIANGDNDDYTDIGPSNWAYVSPSSNSYATASASTPYSSLANGSEVQLYYATWYDLVGNGWCIAWLVLLAALAQGALSQASTHILNMTGIRIKTSLQGLIYRKTLLLNSTCIVDTKGQEADAATTTTVNDKCHEGSKQSTSVNEPKGEHCVKDNDSFSARPDNDYIVGHGEELGMQNDVRHTNGMKVVETSEEKNRNNQTTIDNSLSDIGAITNLMSEDTLNIMSFFWIAHYVWAIPLKIAIVMYLLYLKLGISAVIGSFVCILTMTPLQFLIGKAMSHNAEIMAKFTDNRLKKLHDCFMGIKLIKLNAWDNVFIKKITEARQKELKYLNKDSLYWTLMTILTHISSVLITFVTLAVYVSSESNSEITASRLFSALALFQQLTVPLLIFPITVPIILSAIVSTRRLETFFAAHEIQKQFEGIRNMARILSKSDASLDMYEVKSKSLPANISPKTVSEQQAKAPTKPHEKPSSIKIFIPEKPAPLANSEPQTPLTLPENKETLEFPVDHRKLSSNARKELLRNTPYVVIRPRKNFTMHGGQQTQNNKPQSATQTSGQQPQVGPAAKGAANDRRTAHNRNSKSDSWHRDSLLLKMPDDIAVSVKNCKFSWHPQGTTATLDVGDMVVPRGKLTMIVGKNGSGKSSLLSALLMEMPLISGDMIWNKSSTIAYVPQQPWLLNSSIRENILFGESFRPKRYDFVLDACALKPDIDLMPAGDLTVIGERGINLSGGQRQRVAVARALYSSANVVIMDDPLSSLDNEVARHIFEQSIKKMLLKANRTVILVTQQLNLIAQAHNLIVMKNGCLQASGSYKDIAATHPQIIAKWNSIIARTNEKEQHNNTNDSNALGRTARERWKLFKNVAKLGLQRAAAPTVTAGGVCENGGGAAANSTDAVDTETEMKATSTENILDADEDDEQYSMMTASSSMGSGSGFKLSRSPSGYYSSRHLIYDVPLPLDECQIENVPLRRRRRTAGEGTLRGQRPSSRTSSRMSNISNTPTELRRSLLTDSCGSAVSYMTNLSNYGTEDQRTSKTQSWQPSAGNYKHPPLAKNISAPATFEERAEDMGGEDEPDASKMLMEESERTNSGNGFQQFLRRMTMRKSNKSKAVTQVQHHRPRPGSGDTTIASISEESSGIAGSSIPSIELSSVATTDATETETESWIAGIENEESIQDANIDYKTLMANNASRVENLDDIAPTMTAVATITSTAESTQVNSSDKSGLTNSSVAQQSPDHQTTIKATMEQSGGGGGGGSGGPGGVGYDVERKYGKISSEIYLLYVRASGFANVIIFFITALIWQALRVYTDVWLQQWTDDNSIGNGNIYPQQPQQRNGTATTTKTLLQHDNDVITSANISAATVQQMSVQNYAKMATTMTGNVRAHEILALKYDGVAAIGGGDVGGAGGGMQHEVTYYFHIYAIISCVCIVMAMISTPAGQWAGCKARRNLHDKLLQSIMHKSLHFFQVTPLGRIMNRFSNDMAIIDKKIAATSQRLLQFTLLCMCAILINVIITPWFMVVTVPVCLAYYVIQKFYRCSSRELQRIENATNSPVISHLSETIQGVTTIRAYNQESRFTEILFRRLEENTIAFTILNTSNRWLGISLDYLGGVIVFVAIVTALLAATIACNRGNEDRHQHMMTAHESSSSASDESVITIAFSPSPSLVGLAINYTLLMPIYLNWVVKLLADMEMYVGSVERIAYYAQVNDDSCKQQRNGAITTMGQSETTPTTTATTSQNDNHNNNNNNNSRNMPTKVSKMPMVMAEEVPSTASTKDLAEKTEACSHDKLPTLADSSYPTPSPSCAMTTSLFANDDKSSNETVVTSRDPKTSRPTATAEYKAEEGKQHNMNETPESLAHHLKQEELELELEPQHHHNHRHISNDGHIASTAKSLSHQQISTNGNGHNDSKASLLPPAPSSSSAASSSALGLSLSQDINVSSNSIVGHASPESPTSASWSPAWSPNKLMQRNDVERRASVRRRWARNKKQYDLKVPKDDLKVPKDDLKVPKHDLEVPKDKLKMHKDKVKVHKDIEIPNDDLKVPQDILKVPKDYLKVPKDDLKVHKDDLKVPKDDLKVPKDDLKVPKNDLKVHKDDLKVPKDDLKVSQVVLKVPNDDFKVPKDDLKVPKHDLKVHKNDLKVPKDKLKEAFNGFRKAENV